MSAQLSAGQIIKSLYWGYRQNPHANRHRIVAIFRFLRLYLYLLLLRIRHIRRPMVVISMIGGLGDMTASEPISRRARRQYPDAFIVWVTTPPFVKLTECFEAVDKAVEAGCLTEFMLLLSVGLPGAVIWDLHVSGHSCPQCKAPLRKAGAAGRITLETYFDYGNLLTVFCLCAGIPVIDDQPRLIGRDPVVRAVAAMNLPDRYVVVHCTANDSSRDWSAEKWNQTTAFIIETLGWPIVEIGLVPVVTAIGSSGMYTSLCGKTSFPELIEVVRRAALFVGVESGPGHVANAVKTPGVVLLGQFMQWRDRMPYSGDYETGTAADLLRADGPMSVLPVEAVTGAIERRLGQFPA